MRFLLSTLILMCALLPVNAVDTAQPETGRFNVLFIVVDDLRPELGCYGVDSMHTPNIDRLARSGMCFTHAFCQQAVCSPSRTSVLTGLRPDTTRIYDLITHFRKNVPDALTLPEHFKKHGYHTQALSKVFHNGLDDPQSWSVPHWEPIAETYHNPESLAAVAERRRQLKPQATQMADQSVERDPKTGLQLVLKRNPTITKGPSWEAADVADNELADGKTADKAVALLTELKDKPFFLAVGFYKPHLPFVAPKKYFDLYSPASVRLADNPNPPENVPLIAMHDSPELRSYSDIPKVGPVSKSQARDLIRAYRAATSFTDAQIGRVLDELERLGLRDKTIVVLWGDHGWHLGEHGLWTKHTNFEVATRAPLIISSPGQQHAGSKISSLVEFVDMYPTLCELAGLPIPDGLEGTSLSPLLREPARPWKQTVFSQFPRGKVMGHSIRTQRYRYTEWAEPGKEPVGVELYDHETDPGENVNLANQPQQQVLATQMAERLHAGWKRAQPAGDPK